MIRWVSVIILMSVALVILWKQFLTAPTHSIEEHQENQNAFDAVISHEEEGDDNGRVIAPTTQKKSASRSALAILPGGENTWPTQGDDQNWDQLDTVRVLDNGNLEIPVEEKAGEMVIFGDILMPEAAPTRQWNNKKRVQLAVPEPWPGGRIPIKISVNTEMARKVEEAIAQISLIAPVEFVERRNEADYVEFITGTEHCFSHVGKIGGRQKVSLSAKCDHLEILHELLHTLGLFHEHMRPDRDNHIVVNWANIDEKFWIQFKKLPQMPGLGLEMGDFDWNSLMLYDSNAFAKNAQYPSMIKKDGSTFSAARNGLSQGDIERLNTIYTP